MITYLLEKFAAEVLHIVDQQSALKLFALSHFLYVGPAEFSNKCDIPIHFIVFAIA